jgi:multidrug transporter EmrE-like cation transporter
MSFFNVVFVSLFEIIGDFQLKFFARGGKLANLFGGLAGYSGVIYFLVAALKQGNVLFTNAMWDGMSGLLESLAAYIFLGERLNHWSQYVGLAMITMGLMVLKKGGVAY